MLEIESVYTAYDKADVLQGVSLAVRSGSITCLLGSNGSGKTTLVRSILGLDRSSDWNPPIVLTEAVRGEHVPELWEKIEEHRAFLEQSGQLEERRRANLAREVFAVASSRASRHLERAVADDAELRRLLTEVQARELDPLTAVREILEKVFRIDDGDTGRTRAS